MASDARLEVVDVDTLVIGGGVAGYSAALAAAEHGKVLVLAKDTMRESNSDYAQGGSPPSSVKKIRFPPTSKTR